MLIGYKRNVEHNDSKEKISKRIEDQRKYYIGGMFYDDVGHCDSKNLLFFVKSFYNIIDVADK